MFGFVFWVLILGLSVVEIWCHCSVYGLFVFGDLGFWMELFTDCGLCVCVFLSLFLLLLSRISLWIFNEQQRAPDETLSKLLAVNFCEPSGLWHNC